MWKYYVTGVLTSIITEVLVEEYFRLFEAGIHEKMVFFVIPGGFLAGYIGAKLENKHGKGYVLLSIFTSAILTFIIVFVWVYLIR